MHLNMTSAKMATLFPGEDKLINHATWCRRTWSSLDQLIFFPLFDTDLLPEMLILHCQLDPWQQNAVYLNENFQQQITPEMVECKIEVMLSIRQSVICLVIGVIYDSFVVHVAPKHSQDLNTSP